MKNKTVPVSKMMTISTAHIRDETADGLDNQDGFRSGLAVYEKNEFGWFAHIGNVEEGILNKVRFRTRL